MLNRNDPLPMLREEAKAAGLTFNEGTTPAELMSALAGRNRQKNTDKLDQIKLIAKTLPTGIKEYILKAVEEAEDTFIV
jgi:hypothetical protein